jgi:hypothetical protein
MTTCLALPGEARATRGRFIPVEPVKVVVDVESTIC